MTETIVRWGTLAELLANDAGTLGLQHWHEAGKQKTQVPLDPDWAKAAELERQGIYRCATAWQDGDLVAYADFILGPSLHHASTFHALNIGIYVKPESRGIAPRILRWVEREVRKTAAPANARIIYEAPLGSEWAQVLEALDYERMGSIHGKVIEP